MDCHLVFFGFFKYQKCPKIPKFYLATQMEHDQCSYFCRDADDFCWGPAPVGPTLVTGLFSSGLEVVEKDCQARKLNSEDAIDRSSLKDVW